MEYRDTASQPTGQQPLELTSPQALYALTQHVGDPVLVDHVVRAYRTWNDLVGAERSEIAWKVGAWAAQLRLPPICPAMPDVDPRINVITRYSDQYPTPLRDLADAPVLLYCYGTLPVRTALAVDGAHHPSAGGMAAARAAGGLAARMSIPVVASLDTGCGRAAAQAALGSRGRVIGITAADPTLPGRNSALIEAIVACGGAVVSEHGPGAPAQEGHAFAASRLVAGLANAVVLAELGMHPAGGAHLARAAIALSRYLIVPASQEAFNGVTLSGTALLSRPETFSERLFGSSPHIAARVAAALPPADAVVDDARELARAIAHLAAPDLEHLPPPQLPA